jgi:hypothetical protein
MAATMSSIAVAATSFPLALEGALDVREHTDFETI